MGRPGLWESGMPKKKPALTREAPEERAPLEVTFKEISWEAQQELVTQLDRFLSAYSRRGETGERAAYQEALWAAYGAMQAVAMSCGRYDPGCMEWFRILCRCWRTSIPDLFPPFSIVPRRNGLPTDVWYDRFFAVTALESLLALHVKLPAAARRVIDAMSRRQPSIKELDQWRREFKKGNVKHPWIRSYTKNTRNG